MYLSDENQKQALKILTTNQLMWGKISHKDMLSLIHRPSIRVINLYRDYNFHGEFLWINLVHDGYYLSAYSMGLHESKDRYITESWSIVDYTKYDAKLKDEREHQYRMNIDEVTKTIEADRIRCEDLQTRHNTQKRGAIFEMVAEISDEDGAYSELEDFEALYGDIDDLL